MSANISEMIEPIMPGIAVLAGKVIAEEPASVELFVTGDLEGKARGMSSGVEAKISRMEGERTIRAAVRTKDDKLFTVTCVEEDGGAAIIEVDGAPMRLDAAEHHILAWCDVELDDIFLSTKCVQSGEGPNGTITCYTFEDRPSGSALSMLLKMPHAVTKVVSAGPDVEEETEEELLRRYGIC